MPVPFEALLPYGIIIGMFGVTGFGLGTLKYFANGHKNPRRAIDTWDKQSTYLTWIKDDFNCEIIIERYALTTDADG
ncbi:hypothetical protein AAP_01288 [Ascosphaera apis ARSEF 7405]|uniref:NADH dehydrogenase [ubiquinone] 1 alpha subcomplex subunit 1 n=1 Tax=Ascosphaera apis ARSEF 7405 TaxID=392613 RepID=A0A162IKT0_9EURO|nr:hypothetical protein AAP_01288 [Ascosphaera apis ARSEF 7405]